MKKILKKMLLRFIIFFIVIFLILFVIELCLNISNKKNTFDGWYNENIKINQMNIDKLQNKYWGDNPIWLHEGESIEDKDPNKKRILIVGDSYIWGDGYSNANHMWWQQFKHLLKEKGYGDVEVIAAGFGGYSTKQQFENIIKNEKIIKKINPDLIIIGFVNNDPEFRDENGELMVKSINTTDLYYDSDNLFINSFKKIFPNIYRKICILLTNKYEKNEKFQGIFGLDYYSWLQQISSGEWLNKYEQEVIKPLNDYINNELKIPYFFYMTQLFNEPGIENIKFTLYKNNINHYYLPNLLILNNIQLYEIRYPINPINDHPSVYACQLMAQMLLKVLEEDYIDFLGEKNDIYIPKFNINDWMPFKLNLKTLSENKYSFIYPNSDNENDFLYLPIEKKYIKLNLEDPYNISKIEIMAENVESIELYINVIDEKLGYDTQEMISLGTKNKNFVWEIEDEYMVTSINISADIKDNSNNYFELYVE